MGEDLRYEKFSQNRNAQGNELEFTSLNMWNKYDFEDVKNFVARAIFLNFWWPNFSFLGIAFGVT